MIAMKPATNAPVTWLQYLVTWPQTGSQPALEFPFLPTWATAKAAEMLEMSSMVNTYLKQKREKTKNNYE
jgi:hypothetical protein